MLAALLCALGRSKICYSKKLACTYHGGQFHQQASMITDFSMLDA